MKKRLLFFAGFLLLATAAQAQTNRAAYNMTQFDGGQNRSNYVAFLLRHDFGWSSDHPERRVRFLPQ